MGQVAADDDHRFLAHPTAASTSPTAAGTLPTASGRRVKSSRTVCRRAAALRDCVPGRTSGRVTTPGSRDATATSSASTGMVPKGLERVATRQGDAATATRWVGPSRTTRLMVALPAASVAKPRAAMAPEHATGVRHDQRLGAGSLTGPAASSNPRTVTSKSPAPGRTSLPPQLDERSSCPPLCLSHKPATFPAVGRPCRCRDFTARSQVAQTRRKGRGAGMGTAEHAEYQAR